MRIGLIIVAIIACIAMIFVIGDSISAVSSFNAWKNAQPPETSDPLTPDGYIAINRHADPNAFQDWINYCEYVYPEDSGDLFNNHSAYRPTSEIALVELEEFFDHFTEQAISLREDYEQWYAFDSSVQPSLGDYFHLKYKESTVYGKLGNYLIHYFDAEESTLYVFDCVF